MRVRDECNVGSPWHLAERWDADGLRDLATREPAELGQVAEQRAREHGPHTRHTLQQLTALPLPHPATAARRGALFCEAREVRIVPGKDSTRVVATVRNATRVDVSQLTYAMVKTSVGWRIQDIAYNSHASLAAMLRRKR